MKRKRTRRESGPLTPEMLAKMDAYGRASNYRDCDLEVYDVSIACTLSGVPNNRLVQMNAKTSNLGDSGGPWFYDYKAYGSQKGWCNSKDAWTVADLYDEALGVEFQIYE